MDFFSGFADGEIAQVRSESFGFWGGEAIVK